MLPYLVVTSNGTTKCRRGDVGPLDRQARRRLDIHSNRLRIEHTVNSLRAEWDSVGRSGQPRIVVLDMHKPDAPRLTRWAELGVCEVVYALPTSSVEEADAYLSRLSDKLNALELVVSKWDLLHR
jgi:hypothetical protein